jgi:methyl-accepting chemotaxis protein
MPATLKLVLATVAAVLVGIAASISYGDGAARDGLNGLAVEGWTVQAGQIAASAAGGIAQRNPEAAARAWSTHARAVHSDLLRAVAFDAAGAEVAAYSAPGFGDIASDAMMRTLLRMASPGTAVQPVGGRVVMLAPAQADGIGAPAGYVGLVWDTARFEAVRSALWWRALLAQTLVAIAVLAVIVLAARFFLARPLGALAARARGLFSGDLEGPVAGRDRGDQIGAVARALEGYRTAAIQRAAAERQAEAERAATDSERQETDNTRAAVAKLQAAVVRLIAAALARVAEGDLTARLRVDFPKEYQRLREDFNLAMDRLQDAMLGVVATGGRIGTGTEEMQRAASDLARRAEQQAVGVQRTVAAVGEITQSVSRTAEGAATAREAVAAVAADAGQSQSIVGQAIAAMNGIERSSAEVTKIIGVIDEIAFQTNLLALNAGVEAARAGEAGRGFVVVAQEVRTLAQRSAEAAREIKDLINTSAVQVKSGSRLVTETGETIRRINDSVAGISAIVAEIARSAGEQATGLKRVNTAMGSIDAATQRHGAMAAQFTAASQALAQESETLAALVARFRTESAPAFDRHAGGGQRRMPQPDSRPGEQPEARSAAEPRHASWPESGRGPRADGWRAPRASRAATAFDLDEPSDDAWQEF